MRIISEQFQSVSLPIGKVPVSVTKWTMSGFWLYDGQRVDSGYRIYSSSFMDMPSLEHLSWKMAKKR